MFKINYEYAILLDKLRNEEDLISVEFGYIIFRGWGKSPLLMDIFTSNIPYIQKIYIASLSYAFAYMLCINLKGNMPNRKQWLNVRRVFLSIYLSLI